MQVCYKHATVVEYALYNRGHVEYIRGHAKKIVLCTCCENQHVQAEAYVVAQTGYYCMYLPFEFTSTIIILLYWYQTKSKQINVLNITNSHYYFNAKLYNYILNTNAKHISIKTYFSQ